MRKSLIVFCSLILGGGLLAYSQGLHVVSKTVVFLHHDYVESISDERGTFEVWLKQPDTNVFIPKISSKAGTGFLLTYSNQLFLVTAKHVAIDIGFTGNDKVIVGLENGNKIDLPITALRGTSTNGWIHHALADVSILPLSPSIQIQAQYFQQHFLDAPSLLNPGTNRPPREIELTIVGFPLGIGWGQHPGEDFEPLTRKTRAASGFLADGTLFLLENPSVQGFSGAPIFDLAEPIKTASVFMPAGRPVTCYGLISSTFSDNTGGKMGSVVSARCVWELVRDYVSHL